MLSAPRWWAPRVVGPGALHHLHHLYGRHWCWTQAQKGLGSNGSCDAAGNSLRQTVHTHCASVHQAAFLRVAGQLQAWRKVMAAYRQVYDSLAG